MANRRTFDEVMIVNPFDPRRPDQGGEAVRFAHVSHPGYAEVPVDGYGYYGEPYEVAEYAEPYEVAEYAPVEGYGYYGGYPGGYGESEYAEYEVAEPVEVGYYGETPEMVGYSEYAPVEGYGYSEYAPVEGYAEYAPVEGYAEYAPVEGYAEYAPVEGYDEYQPAYGEADYSEYQPAYGEVDPTYAEADVAGYTAERAPRFNPSVLVSANVNGYGEPMDFAGYQTPTTVSPTVTAFKPPPGQPGPMPDQFRPLW
jgi:hypothetical protein